MPQIKLFQPVNPEIIIKQHVVGTNLIAPPTNHSASFNEDLDESQMGKQKQMSLNRSDVNKQLRVFDLPAPHPSSWFLSASAGPKRIKKTGRQPDGTWKVMLDFRCRVERDRLNGRAGRFNKVCHAHARRAALHRHLSHGNRVMTIFWYGGEPQDFGRAANDLCSLMWRAENKGPLSLYFGLRIGSSEARIP